MRIHHLNCGTINVPAGAALIGTGGFFTPARGVTHCILAETDDGLLLVDTGWGTGACLTPTFPMRLMLVMSGTRCDLEEMALRQVERLGHSAGDVKHIALTHFHFDHAGGLPDFPRARVHVYREEYEAITQPRDMYERYPYRPEHWAHGPDWVVHDLAEEGWFGFDCTPLVELGPVAFCLVPLTGHTRGHSGIALRVGDQWILHCGDAYTYHKDVDPHDPQPPPYQRTLRRFLNLNRAMRPIGIHSPRLRALLRQHGDRVQLTCSHDPVELHKFNL
jgi:glyoxylase-like metal-dependent hydrolase (beta-lactamase superfamily II)